MTCAREQYQLLLNDHHSFTHLNFGIPSHCPHVYTRLSKSSNRNETEPVFRKQAKRLDGSEGTSPNGLLLGTLPNRPQARTTTN